MALVNAGSGRFLLGPQIISQGGYSGTATPIGTTEAAYICIGEIITSDGLPHTLDTTGASGLSFRAQSATHVDPATIVKIGLAAPDLAVGPPGRAVNVANIITFDVSRTIPTGGVVTNAWNTHKPDTGSKVINNGDFVAFAIQMTVRGGADTFQVISASYSTIPAVPATTSLATGGVYTASLAGSNVVITFSDGALGHFTWADLFTLHGTNRTVNNVSNPREFGQLFFMPYPYRVYGMYGLTAIGGDMEINLYTNPAAPVAERTVAIDANVANVASTRWWYKMFPTPFDVAANQSVVAAVKGTTATNVSTISKAFADPSHRVAEVTGLYSRGVQRAVGAAFVDISGTPVDMLHLGLLINSFDAGSGGAGGGSGRSHDRLGL